MLVTRDRERIVHLAGRGGLSPALRGGAPALLAPGDQEGRCGWEPFFLAMEARRLALAYGEEGGFRFVPRSEGGGAPGEPARRGWLGGARRFVAAFVGRPHPGS